MKLEGSVIEPLSALPCRFKSTSCDALATATEPLVVALSSREMESTDSAAETNMSPCPAGPSSLTWFVPGPDVDVPASKLSSKSSPSSTTALVSITPSVSVPDHPRNRVIPESTSAKPSFTGASSFFFSTVSCRDIIGPLLSFSSFACSTTLLARASSSSFSARARASS